MPSNQTSKKVVEMLYIPDQAFELYAQKTCKYRDFFGINVLNTFPAKIEIPAGHFHEMKTFMRLPKQESYTLQKYITNLLRTAEEENHSVGDCLLIEPEPQITSVPEIIFSRVYDYIHKEHDIVRIAVEYSETDQMFFFKNLLGCMEVKHNMPDSILFQVFSFLHLTSKACKAENKKLKKISSFPREFKVEV